MTNNLHPGLFAILIACITICIPVRYARIVALLTPLCCLYLLGAISGDSSLAVSIAGYPLDLLTVDAQALPFLMVFALVALLGFLFTFSICTRLGMFGGLFYYGSAQGVLLAGDLITFFIFWELLTFGAALLIIERGTITSLQSAKRYINYHVVGGSLFLLGLIIHLSTGATTAIDHLNYTSISGLLMFLGIGINSAWPLLHTWLVDSYSEASIGGVIFLSAFTTKTAIYALIRLFPGAEPLIIIGALMAVFPIFYAVIENDLRRVLAYSLINQVGFMVVGVGIGSSLAIAGSIAHAVVDCLFKALLFMSVGAVMYRTGESRASELGGLYRYMPFTCLFCIIGAAAISAVPLFSGFVSKSMIVDAVGSQQYVTIWLILLFASAGVFHHAGIKVPFFTFFAHSWKGPAVKEAPRTMLLAMLVTACICIAIGVLPNYFYQLLPSFPGYQPYSQSHIVFQLQLLLFSALAFTTLMLVGLYPPELKSVNLDCDIIYRRTIPRIIANLTGLLEITKNFFVTCIIFPIVRLFSANLLLQVARSFASPEGRPRLEEIARVGFAPIGTTLLLVLLVLIIILAQIV